MASITEGIYEIYPAIAKPGSVALDVSGSGIANGTNVIIWGRNGNNNQKWYLKQESTGKWSLRSVHSGKYLDVNGGVAAMGTNIQVWEDNDLTPQRWKLTKVREVTVNGVACVVATVGSYVTPDGSTWMMDLRQGLTDWNTNVRLWEANGAIAQEWILVPSTAEDPTMPVPYNLGIAETRGSYKMEPYIKEDTPFYPSWVCAPSWVNGGNNFYETRYRLRYMKSGSSYWQPWSDWSTWTNASVTTATDGSRQNWATSPYEVEYQWANVKNAEFEYQVRSAATGSSTEDPHHSLVAARTLNAYKKPTVTITATGWTPEGLRIGWSSDYTYGATYLTVKKVMFDGVVAYNSAIGYQLQGTGSASSALFPAELLSKWPQNGQTASVTYDVGYDQAPQLNQPNTNTSTVSFDSGTTTIIPSFMEVGAKLYAVVGSLTTTRVWIAFEDKLIECFEDPSISVRPGAKAFDVPYPMRKAFRLYVSTVNSTGSRWANAFADHAGVNRYANAWSWKGGSAYLIYSPDRPNIATSYNPVYSAEVLDGREHEAVQFTKTVKVAKEVSGDLMPNDTSTIEDFEALLEAGHAVFRSMNGEIYDVAITGVTANEVNNSYTEITVSMIVESV